MLGGSMGAALRYSVSLLCQHWRCATLPWATFIVNILGCFLLGLLMGLAERHSQFSGGTYLLLTVGLCGAFTTFSTFTSDTFRLADNGQWLIALTYITASIVIGFVMFYLGKSLLIHH